MCNTNQSIYIPGNVSVYKPFTRYEPDVIFLDHMKDSIHLCADMDNEAHYDDMPLFYLRNALLGRRQNMFRGVCHIYNAMNKCHIEPIFVQTDMYELTLQPVLRLETHLPTSWYWIHTDRPLFS